MSGPQPDPAAERAVLAAIFQHGNRAYVDVGDLVTARSFGVDSNQFLYKCLAHVLDSEPNAQPDVPSVASAARSLGYGDFFAKPEELKHLRAVMGLAVDPSNARRMAAKVRKLEIARLMDGQLAKARTDLSKVTGDEGVAHILGLAENPIFDFTAALSSDSREGPQRMGAGAPAYVRHLLDNPRQLVGISSGLQRFDRAIGGGLRPNSVDVIAARPKTGKSFLVDRAGLHIAEQSIPVLNCDTEMTREEHLHRVLANMTGLDILKIEAGDYGKDFEARRKLEEAAAKLAELPYDYACIAGQPFEETLAHMRRWVLQKVGTDDNGHAKPCAILFDYLKLMDSEGLSKNLAEYQLLGFIATGLKNFMAKHRVPCLCFAQLNREHEVAASDRIIWFATSFSTYEWLEDEERGEVLGQERYTHKLTTKYARHGAGTRDGDWLYLRADYARGRVYEGRMKSERAAPAKAEGFVVNDDGKAIQF